MPLVGPDARLTEPMTSEPKFEVGQVVWTKKPTWPWWPAIILDWGENKSGNIAYRMQLLDAAFEEHVFEEKMVKAFDEKKRVKDLRKRSIERDSFEKLRPPYSQAIEDRYEEACDSAEREHASWQLDEEDRERRQDDDQRCAVCLAPNDPAENGEIILCDGRCRCAFHLACVALTEVPEADWKCARCSQPAGAAADPGADPSVGATSLPPPLPPGTRRVEVRDQKTGAYRPAHVIDERRGGCASGTYLKFDQPEAPLGVYLYLAKENETLGGIAEAMYDEDVVGTLRDALVGFQQLITAAKLTLASKLEARTHVMLPEYVVVEVEGETLEMYAQAFGRDMSAMLALNAQVMEGHRRSSKVMEHQNIWEYHPVSSQPLPEGMILLLPKAMPVASSRRPRGPAVVLPPAQVAATRPSGELEVRDKVWVKVKGILTGDDESGGDDRRKWQLAKVHKVFDTTFSVIDVGGDKGWKETYRLMDEGDEHYVRAAAPWPASYQPEPTGALGTGILIPPFASHHSVERFYASDMRKHVLPRPAPPRDGWVAELTLGTECEVLFGGAWHPACLTRHTSLVAGIFELDLMYHDFTVEVDATQLRPLSEPADAADEEGEPAKKRCKTGSGTSRSMAHRTQQPLPEVIDCDEDLVDESDGYALHLSAKSSSGYLGVGRRGRRFVCNHRNTRVGTFKTALEAAVAYAKAAATATEENMDVQDAAEKGGEESGKERADEADDTDDDDDEEVVEVEEEEDGDDEDQNRDVDQSRTADEYLCGGVGDEVEDEPIGAVDLMSDSPKDSSRSDSPIAEAEDPQQDVAQAHFVRSCKCGPHAVVHVRPLLLICVVCVALHYSDARTVVKRLNDLDKEGVGALNQIGIDLTPSEVRFGAKEVLEERFASEDWSRAYVPGLLGMRNFPENNLLKNERPADFGKDGALYKDKAGTGELADIGVAIITQGDKEIVGACSFNLVRESKRDRGAITGSNTWGMEIILFAVKRSFEGQKVASSLNDALFKFCHERDIKYMTVLNQKRVGQSRTCFCATAPHPCRQSLPLRRLRTGNWWVDRGGFTGGISNAFTNFASLNKHCMSSSSGLTKKTVPEQLIIPWDMHKDDASERLAEASARKELCENGLTVEDMTIDKLTRCEAYNKLSVLIVSVDKWYDAHRVDGGRPVAPAAPPASAAPAAPAAPAALAAPAATPADAVPPGPAGPSRGVDSDDEHVDSDDEHVDIGDERVDSDDEHVDAAAPTARRRRQAPQEEDEPPLVAGGGDMPRRRRGAVGRVSIKRSLRCAEFMMGSGVLTRKMVSHGKAHVLGVERQVNAPEYDGTCLKRPPTGAAKPEVGDALKAMRLALRKGECPQVFLEICQCRDLQPEDLPTLDFAHFSPQCTSVSRAAGSKHKRTASDPDGPFLGPKNDAVCREYNADRARPTLKPRKSQGVANLLPDRVLHTLSVSWIFEVIRDQIRRPNNAGFKFTLEAPKGIVRKLLMIQLIETPVEHGGCGGICVEIDQCKFGTDYQKPTLIFTNIESIVADLKPFRMSHWPEGVKDGNHHKLCCKCPCPNADDHPRLGYEAGPTADAARFPPALVGFLWDHVDQACSHRRCDDTPAWRK